MIENDLVTSLFFKKTIIHLLKNKEGIIISVDKKLKPLYPGQEKIMVFKYNDEIHILDYDGELNDGEFIEIELDDKNN